MMTKVMTPPKPTTIRADNPNQPQVDDSQGEDHLQEICDSLSDEEKQGLLDKLQAYFEEKNQGNPDEVDISDMTSPEDE